MTSNTVNTGVRSNLSDQIGQFVTVPNSFINGSRSLSSNAKWLFVVLRYHTNRETGEAFPSYDKLQEETGLYRRNVASAIKELVAAGWLEKQKRYNKSTIYTLKIPSVSSSKNETANTVSSSKNGTASSSSIETASSSTLVHTNQIDITREGEPEKPRKVQQTRKAPKAKQGADAPLSTAVPFDSLPPNANIAPNPAQSFKESSVSSTPATANTPPPAPTKAPPPARPPRPNWDFVVKVSGYTPQMLESKTLRGTVGAAVRDLDAIGFDDCGREMFLSWLPSDWRVKQGQRLTPHQIVLAVPTALSPKSEHANEPAGFAAIREAMSDPRYQTNGKH